jgi:hypothetical protein
MPTMTIRIEIPEGFTVTTDMSSGVLTGREPGVTNVIETDSAKVEDYYRNYLSDNGRELYRAAAEIELVSGHGYTFDDIAEKIGRGYSATLSLYRTTGRTAKKWRKAKNQPEGTPAPIQLVDITYSRDEAKGGWRTSYHLPDGIAEQIVNF